jgi:hypothetical protein
MQEPSESRRTWRLPWLVAGAGLAVFVAVLTGLLLLFGWVAGKVKDLGPIRRIVDTTIYSSAITEVKRTPKLVLSTVEIEVTVIRSFAGDVELFGVTVSTGKCLVTVSAPGNKVQFYVPLDSINPNAFTIDHEHKKVILRVPPPKPDLDMVVAQNDRRKMKIEAVSTRTLGKTDEEYMIQSAVNNLKSEVLRRLWCDKLLQSKVASEAREILLERLHPFQDRLPPGYIFDIVFDPATAKSEPSLQ